MCGPSALFQNFLQLIMNQTGMADHKEVYVVWLNEKQRIASFHEMKGYEEIRFRSHSAFINYIRLLQEQNYRFQ